MACEKHRGTVTCNYELKSIKATICEKENAANKLSLVDK